MESDALQTLRAAALYLRPCDRGRLLTSLTLLGLYVHELAPGEALVLGTADFGVVIANTSSAHAERVRELSEQQKFRIVTLLPAGSDPAPFASATVALEDESAASLRAAIAPVAAAVRSERQARLRPRTLGGLALDHELATLSSAVRSVRLERGEGRLIGALVKFPSTPVGREALSKASGLPGGELRATVRAIRAKVGALGGDPNSIATVRGFGYLALP